MLQNTIINIYGRKGSGKTHFLERLVRMIRNVVVVDIFGSYIRVSKTKLAELLPGFVICRGAEALEKKICGGGIFNKPKAENKIIFIPNSDWDGELSALWSILQNRTKKFRNDISVVIDEVDMLNRSGIHTHPTVEEFIKRGRHFRINQIYATRRPFEIPRLISSQADDFYIFQITEDRDLEYIKRMPGGTILKANIDTARDNGPGIRSLHTGDYLHFNVHSNKLSIYRSGL